jgi:hypothetical protein
MLNYIFTKPTYNPINKDKIESKRMENTKEVVFELTGKTEVVKKVKVTLDETIDIDNPPNGLYELIKERFLRNYNQKTFQEETITILNDEDCDTFENEFMNGQSYDDYLIYMSEEFSSYPTYSLEPTPQWGCCRFMIDKGIKSVMTFGQMDIESFENLSVYNKYFEDSYEIDGEHYYFTKEKDEIIEMWENKDFKSIKNDTHSWGDIPKFKLFHNLFEERSPNKEYQKVGGIFLLVIRDIESFRRNDNSKDSTILEKIIL